MNKTQKGAVYGLILTAFLLLIPAVDLIDTKVNPVLLRVVAYPLALVLVVPIYFIEKKNSHKVSLDERDKLIVKRAILVACALLFGLMVVAYVTVYFITPGSTGSIPVSHLPEILYVASIVFILTLSIAILVQYGRGGKDAD
jgi:hypothetical protein